MEIEFDPAKDRANIAKHGVSLVAARDFDMRAVVPDERRVYGEERFNAFGLINGRTYCLTFTRREGRFRAISLRRTHVKEYRRYVV